MLPVRATRNRTAVGSRVHVKKHFTSLTTRPSLPRYIDINRCRNQKLSVWSISAYLISVKSKYRTFLVGTYALVQADSIQLAARKRHTTKVVSKYSAKVGKSTLKCRNCYFLGDVFYKFKFFFKYVLTINTR